MGRQEADMMYYQLNKDRERSNIDKFLATDPETLTETSPTTMYSKPAGPEKQGVLGAGVSKAKDVGMEGIHQFGTAMENFANSRQSASDYVSGAGQSVLGGLSVMAALPMGAGAAIRQFMKNYTPGMEDAPVIPSAAAASIRFALGMPNMLLDPEARKLLFSKPGGLTDEQEAQRAAMIDDLWKPMTAGEVMENATMFAAPGLVGKAVKGLVRSKAAPSITPEPLEVQAATVTPEAPSNTVKDLGPQLASVVSGLEGTTESAGKTAPKPKKAAKEKTVVMDSYLQELQNSYDLAMKQMDVELQNVVKENPELSHLVQATAEDVKPTTEGATPTSEVPMVPGGKKNRPKLGEMGPLGGQAGKIDPMLLANMIVGGAIGGTQGDTPEERIAGILTGVLGGALARKYAPKFVASLKGAAPALFSDTNPRMPGAILPTSTPIEQTTSVINKLAGEHKSAIDSLLAREPGEKLAPTDISSARAVLGETAKRLNEMTKGIIKGEVYPSGELRDTLALSKTLYDTLRGEGHRAGVIPGAQNVKANYGQISKLAREFNPEYTDMQIAQALRARDSSGKAGLEEMSKLARINYAIPEALTETMYSSMLTGTSIIRNGVGNAPMIPIALVDRSLASLKFWDPARPKINEVTTGATAVWEAMQEQWQLFSKRESMKGYWDTLDTQRKDLGGTHVEQSPEGYAALAQIARESGSEGLATGLEYVHTMFRDVLGPGIMSRTDGMFKAVNGRLATHWEAMRAASDEGFTNGSTEYWNRVDALKNDVSQLSADSLVRIKQFRDHQTFTVPFENSIMKALQGGPENPWVNLAHRMFIAPFLRTPVRLAETFAEYTPGLNRLTSNYYREIAQGGASKAVADARMLTGSLMVGSFAWAAMKGMITGSARPEEEITRTQAGRPPQSFWDPLSEKYRSYAGIEPLSSFAGMGAELVETIPKLETADAEHVMKAAATAFYHNVGTSSFVQGMSEFFDILKKGFQSDAEAEQWFDFMRKKFAQFEPQLFREVSGTVQGDRPRVVKTGEYDESRSISGQLAREVRALMDTYRMGVGVRESGTILQERNMFTGDVIARDAWPMNPFKATPNQVGPWASEIARLDGAGLKRLPDWIGQQQTPSTGTDLLKLESPALRLAAPEIDRRTIIMTQEVKLGGEHLIGGLNALVESKVYKDSSDAYKADLIRQRFHEYRQAAEARLLIENEGLRKDYERKLGRAAIQTAPVARQPSMKEQLDKRLGTTVAP